MTNSDFTGSVVFFAEYQKDEKNGGPTERGALVVSRQERWARQQRVQALTEHSK